MPVSFPASVAAALRIEKETPWSLSFGANRFIIEARPNEDAPGANAGSERWLGGESEGSEELLFSCSNYN